MKIGLKHYEIDKERLPNSLIIRGYVLLAIVIGIALSLLFIIPVQQKITGQAVLLQNGINSTLLAPLNGELRMYKKSGDPVEQGEILGTMNWDITKDVIDSLRAFSINANELSYINRVEIQLSVLQDLHIEGLQDDISNALNNIRQVKKRQIANQPKPIITKLQNEISVHQENLNKLDHVKSKINATASVIQQQLTKDKSLYESGAISYREYDNRQTELLNIEERQAQLELDKQATLTNIAALETEVTRVQQSYRTKITDDDLLVSDALSTLLSEIETRLEERLLYSPMSGRLDIDPESSNRINYTIGEPIAQIIPDETTATDRYIVYAPPTRIGEIQPGQKVYIAIDEYSSRDYGFVRAEVQAISDLSYDSLYRVELLLNDGLITTHGIKLPARLRYTGRAQIMTNKRSIASLILQELSSRQEELSLK